MSELQNWETLGARLKWLRELRGYTQESLAEGVGLSRSAVQHYERDSGRPGGGRLSRLAVFLNCGAEWLAEGKGAKPVCGSGGGPAAPGRGVSLIPLFSVADGASEEAPFVYLRDGYVAERWRGLSLAWVVAEGSAMSPLFVDGDQVLVDVSPAEMLFGHVYGWVMDSTVKFGRLTRFADSVFLRPENRAWPDVCLPSGGWSGLGDGRVIRVLGCFSSCVPV